MSLNVHPDAITNLINGDHGAPFDVLGRHVIDEDTVSVRVFRPSAARLYVVNAQNSEKTEMQKLRDEGFFECTISGVVPEEFQYTLLAKTYDDQEETFHDPYDFPSQFTDYDLHLFGEGRLLYAYEKLGAHLCEINGVTGVNFALWAPNAYRVSIIGEFNHWDARAHPMRLHGTSGIWELFIPGLDAGAYYKFDLRSKFNNYHTEKTDPYGFYAELRPRTASIVIDMDQYQWQDEDWMAERVESEFLDRPLAIYEVHLGSWRRAENNKWLSYRDLADQLVSYVKSMNYTHIELMPVAEHPFDGSWGYQVTGYFAPTSRFGTPDDFMYFVDQCHQNGIGVILDWVPAHFPKDGHALSYFDGTHLYEHADPRKGEHPDWGTYIFNYGRNEVANFLVANALFWLKQYHIDGLRVDAVSSMLYLDFGRKDDEWLPNQYGSNENLEAITFLKYFNEVVHGECPGTITIAEESTAWPMVSRPTYIGGLGFTFKWNMGWMHDTLDYMKKDPIYRRYHHNKMTFSMMYAFSENFVLSLSHDEVVHGKGSMINKMPGDWWQKLASLRLLHGYQYTHPGKKLTFMGQEFGQWQEWSEARSLDWHLLDWPTHKKLQIWVKDMNALYQEQPALHENDVNESGFQWIEANDSAHSIFTYLRFAQDPSDFLVIACNFTPVPRYNYQIGVPEPGHYAELLNSDSEYYGGGNIGNDGGRWSQDVHWQGYPHSLLLSIPPLGIVILKKDQ